MSKKQQNKKTSSKKTSSKKTHTARVSATASKPGAAKRGRKAAAANAAPIPAGGSALGDPRLPQIGTTIQKRDRYGTVRCECTVEDGGIRYGGNLYRSLSAAAMAAAKDLRLTNKTQNGYTFWGLSKPRSVTADPLAALDRTWERYRGVAAAVVAGATDTNRAQLLAALKKHGQAVDDLHSQVA